MQPIRIALVGDFSELVTAHRAIDESINLAARETPVEAHWINTSTLQPGTALSSFHGVWCVPGSPYANTEGALRAIEWARTKHVPFFGTCGGFQHAVLEFARHVLGRADAAHAELDPSAAFPVVAPLACALVEKSERILPTGRGRFAQWFGEPRTEGFHCSFGLNPACETMLEKNGLETVARGESGAVRAMELREHPFFIGTLFQPERAALRGELHPLVSAFIETAAKVSNSHVTHQR